MAQFWALSTNDDTLVGCALAPFNEKVDLLKDDAGGWGLGYYSRGELLQRVEPRGRAAVLDIGEVVRDIRADMVIMHARSATVGTVRRENIHPFRFKEWLFAHNGTTVGFDQKAQNGPCSGILSAKIPPNILKRLYSLRPSSTS